MQSQHRKLWIRANPAFVTSFSSLLSPFCVQALQFITAAHLKAIQMQAANTLGLRWEIREYLYSPFQQIVVKLGKNLYKYYTELHVVRKQLVLPILLSHVFLWVYSSISPFHLSLSVLPYSLIHKDCFFFSPATDNKIYKCV